jgi:glycosyltransferase involved in cell wall biosynthesis
MEVLVVNNKNNIKVLMELRPCFWDFAGIPQETRLEFHAMNRLRNIDVTGLINHTNRRLWPGLRRNHLWGAFRPDKRVHRLSRFVLSVKEDPIDSWMNTFLLEIGKKIEAQQLSQAALFGFKIPLYDFDAADFGDFIWQTLFSKTLPARDYEEMRNARYVSMRPSWDVLTRMARTRLRRMRPLRFCTLNTHGYDVFVTQTPWPTQVTPNTQLVVRYHDAIPLFLPHTIPHARAHQLGHMANLTMSQEKGIFSCISNATRQDLLKVFPHLEHRSVVIPNIVSHEYYVEQGNEKYIANIIRNYIAVETEPKFLTSREKENFYQRHLMSQPIRFIMSVSSLEPRKNQMKLIGAWDYLKNHGMPDLKLLIVGVPGWDYKRIIDAMAPWQQRGDIFHVQRVPAGQLRVLYNAAETVVCPSIAEGFDLSGIEAMLCGGAVIASDIPAHREIYGNACEYFNPYSALDQAKTIEKVIHQEQRVRRQELISEGLKHAPRYRRESVEPYWQDLFEQIQGGAFKHAFAKKYASEPVMPKPLPIPAEDLVTTKTYQND